MGSKLSPHARQHLELARGYTRKARPERPENTAPVSRELPVLPPPVPKTDTAPRPPERDTGSDRGAENRLLSGGVAHPSSTPAAKRVFRNHKPRTTLVRQAPPTPAALLDGLPTGEEWLRVILVGVLGDGTLDGLRRWATAELREPWRHGSHYAEDPARPVLKFENTTSGQRVTVIRASSWFGDDATSVDSVRDSWSQLDELVAAGWSGAKLLDSPAGTGTDLFLRSIPKGREWPTPPSEVAELIRATSGQGRIECCPADFTIPRLIENDGRLMYGGLCWSLPGAFVSDDDGPYVPFARARYLVRVEVPAGWDHVGILGVKDSTGPWRYPSKPGEVFETWADGSELAVASDHGWPFVVLRRLMFEEGKPLDKWAEQLVGLGLDESLPKLVRVGARAMLLHGLGSFTGRPRRLTRSVPLAEAERVPPEAVDVRVEAGEMVYAVEERPRQPMLVQPQWPAAVWGRARAALLDRPRLGVGALRLPRETVVAFRTDAIYTTEPTGWADDGKAGRFRVKSTREGPFPAPMSSADLLAIRDEGRAV